VSGGLVVEELYDTTGNGQADQRAVYEGGELVRLDADTTASGKPDTTQYFSGGKLVRQDQDDDGDGLVDSRFDGDEAATVPPGSQVPGSAFGKLGCGRFDRFWAKR
jgi:hypothetical protein